MSGRPSTEIDVRVGTIGDAVVSFSLEDMGPAVGRLLKRRWKAHERRRVAHAVVRQDHAVLTALLDAAWQETDLGGAALLWGGGHEGSYKRCEEPLLALNVLSRTRDNLLLVESAPVIAEAALWRHLVTDDPRLTSLVAGGGGSR